MEKHRFYIIIYDWIVKNNILVDEKNIIKKCKPIKPYLQRFFFSDTHTQNILYMKSE